jgi:3-oxoacyl-[acyl-carrier protein] reductase
LNLGLTGRVAIVTGASRGIGRAIAETLAAEGMLLSVVARSGEPLRDLAASLPTPCLVQAADLRDAQAPAAVVAGTIEHFGQLDLLVNNAGATKRGEFRKLSDADWDDGFDLKFFGAMRCCRAAWPHLQATQGSIVNIVGIGGRTASADFTIGGTVNAALLNLTKALADLGVQDHVRVNAINPGAIVSERLEGRLKHFASEHQLDPAEAKVQMARTLGIARFGLPTDVARLVAFLASAQSAFCHGAIVDIDGGQTRTL